jgi:hypothetical protein
MTKSPSGPPDDAAAADPAETGAQNTGTQTPIDPELVERDAPEFIPPALERRLAPARDPVQRFINEARRYPRLDEKQERELIQAARERGDVHAARTLVLHNLRLVVSIAYQYRRAWLNLLDLFQEGAVGLMEAVRRWDPDMGTRFGSYAAYWIRACILRFLMTNSRLVHVGNTRAGRKLFFRLEKERQKLLAEGIDPTPKLLTSPRCPLTWPRVRSPWNRGRTKTVCPWPKRYRFTRLRPNNKRSGVSCRRPCAGSWMISRARSTTNARGPCGRNTWLPPARRFRSQPWARAMAFPSSAWARSPRS